MPWLIIQAELRMGLCKTRHETPKPLKNMGIDAYQGLAMAGVIPPTGMRTANENAG